MSRRIENKLPVGVCAGIKKGLYLVIGEFFLDSIGDDGPFAFVVLIFGDIRSFYVGIASVSPKHKYNALGGTIVDLIRAEAVFHRSVGVAARMKQHGNYIVCRLEVGILIVKLKSGFAPGSSARFSSFRAFFSSASASA